MKNTVHFKDMLNERGIKIEWVDRTVQEPDKVEDHDIGVEFLGISQRATKEELSSLQFQTA